MRITYDAEADALYVCLRVEEVVESNEVRPGVILDLDAEGQVVGVEILAASGDPDDPRRVEPIAHG